MMYFCFQFLLFLAKDLVGNDAARLNATFDHAVRGLADSVGWVVATCCQSCAQSRYQSGAALVARWINHRQVDDPEKRIDAGKQIAFLAVAADVLNDDFLDLSLAEEFDCRDLGLLYYVMASSDTPCSASPVTAASPMKLSCFSTEKRPSLRSA